MWAGVRTSDPGTRCEGLGIWAGPGTAGCCQSSYCPTCLSAHTGSQNLALVFRSGRGTLRDLWPQAPEDEEVQPGGGLSGPREEEDVKKQGPPAVAWAGSSLSAATMHLPRGREQAGDCTGVCWAHWYRGEPVHGQWGALTRPPGTEVSVQVRGPPAPQAGSGLSPGR